MASKLPTVLAEAENVCRRLLMYFLNHSGLEFVEHLCSPHKRRSNSPKSGLPTSNHTCQRCHYQQDKSSKNTSRYFSRRGNSTSYRKTFCMPAVYHFPPSHLVSLTSAVKSNIESLALGSRNVTWSFVVYRSDQILLRRDFM